MNISKTKSVSLVYEDLSKIVNEIVNKQFRSRHPDGDSDIDLQHLFSIINLKNPENDNDATNKQFVLTSIRDDTIHVNRKGDIMHGNLDMGGNFFVTNVNDKDMNPPDTHAATVGYVNRKIASYIPKANLNIICSQGFKGKKGITSRTDDIYKFFPAGVVLPTDAIIEKISLTTTNDTVENSKHKLTIKISDPLNSGDVQTETVFEKLGSQLYFSQQFRKPVGNKKISFQLDSFVDSAPVAIFAGESTLTLEISV